MNNYITLDGLKYHTSAKSWKPDQNVPATVRLMMDGSLDATFGVKSLMIWNGEIEGPVTPEGEGWGTIDDLRTTLLKRTTLSFQDHYALTTYTVVAQGPYAERSLGNKWDEVENVIYKTVRLVTTA